MEVTDLSLKSPVDPPDPLIAVWHDRIKAAKSHWESMHKRARYARKLIQNIDNKEVENDAYSPARANLIQSTLRTVQSRVYAKTPELDCIPTKKNQDLKLFCKTVKAVTQAMLDDAGLKQNGKRAVRAALTAKIGCLKVMYQRDMRTDPIIQARIEDTQDNINRINGLLAELEDEQERGNHEAKLRELQESIKTLEQSLEVVAGEGITIDVVRIDRLLPDVAIDDFWDYQRGMCIIEMIPMRMTDAKGRFKDVDLDSATSYQAGKMQEASLWQENKGEKHDDPMIMVYECWSKADNQIYTLIDGVKTEWARPPYQPQNMGERWYPYFLLPFETVDGCFEAQSLVDSLEKLQKEHNAAREKEAQLRDKYNPHYICGGDINEKNITRKTVAGIGEIVILDTGGQPLNSMFQASQDLRIDPMMADTSRIGQDWEMVSGLQDAARSTVVDPKTATEATIMEQSLAARVSDFRDQIEDWLSEIGKYSAELCMLNMTSEQVAEIVGDEMHWVQDASPDAVFGMISMKVRAGSTGSPNKLQSQQIWTQALPAFQPLIMQIRQLEASGADASPERELMKETASRFDEHIDVERFLPPLPQIPQLPAMPGGQTMPMLGGLPQSSIPLQ